MAFVTTDFTREQYLEKPLPSSSPESERVILGAILLDNAADFAGDRTAQPRRFLSPLHRRIFRSMMNRAF
jgi:replicative DNA helicase